MFSNLPILPALVAIPLIGALFLAFVSWLTREEGREQTEKNAPRTALLVSLIVLLLSIVLVIDFDPSNPDFQFMDQDPWLGGGSTRRCCAKLQVRQKDVNHASY